MRVVATLSGRSSRHHTNYVLALADILAKVYGKRVVLCDLDPESYLSVAALGQLSWEEAERFCRTTADVPLEDPSEHVAIPIVRVHGAADCVLLPGSPRLLSTELSFLTSPPSEWRRARGELVQDLMEGLSAGWDYVLIACPPGLGPLTQVALDASTGYLMLAEPSLLSAAALYALPDQVMSFASAGASRVRYATVVTRAPAYHSEHVYWSAMSTNKMLQPILMPGFPASTPSREWVGNEPMSLHERWGDWLGAYLQATEDFIRRVG